MADKLESYFKKHLSDETPGEENWNVPSDDVWDKVLPEIQKKRGLFIPLQYLYIIGILVVIGLASIIWMVNRPDSPTDNTNISDNKMASPTDTKLVEETVILVDTQEPPSQNKINNTEESQTDNETIATTIVTDGQSGQTGTDHKTVVFGENTSNELLTSEAEAVKKETVLSPVSIENERQNIDINLLASRSFDNITSAMVPTLIENTELLTRSPGETLSNVNEPINNKGKFGIGAFLAPTWNGTKLTGNLSTGVIETSDMLLYSTNWGFEFRYFTLVTGVEKSEIKSWSKSLIDFAYDSSTEHMMPDGEMENTSPVPMQTPFGEIDTKITYRFPGDQTIPDGEPMYSAMETHQELRYLSIPLGVEYNIMRFSRFNWFAEGGLRYNRALKDATQFTSRVLHEGHDMDVVDEEMTSHPTYTENYLSFYVGTGLNYQFSKSFQINTSGRYFGSITKVNLQDNLSTYVHGYNLKLGVVYIF